MQVRQFAIVVTALALTVLGLLFLMPGVVGTERFPHDPTRPTEVLGQGTPVGQGQPQTTAGADGEEVTSMGNLGVSVGHVFGLWPGRTAPLPVTFTNPNAFPVSVTAKVAVTSATTAPERSAAGCTPADLDVPSGPVPADPLPVAADASTSTSVPVRLSRTATDGCKGASFTVSVTAWAVER